MNTIIEFLENQIVRNIALIQAVIISSIYVITVYMKYGVQPSVSQSWDDMVYKRRWTFRVMIFSVSLAIIISDVHNLFLVASGCLLTLVGFFTHIHILWKKVVHLVGAICCIVFAFIGFFYHSSPLSFYLIIITLVAAIIVVLSCKLKNILWNLELVVFPVIYVGIAIIINK